MISRLYKQLSDWAYVPATVDNVVPGRRVRFTEIPGRTFTVDITNEGFLFVKLFGTHTYFLGNRRTDEGYADLLVRSRPRVFALNVLNLAVYAILALGIIHFVDQFFTWTLGPVKDWPWWFFLPLAGAYIGVWMITVDVVNRVIPTRP